MRGDFSDGAHSRSVYQTMEANAVVSSLVAAAACTAGAIALQRSKSDATLRSLLTLGAVAFAGKAALAAWSKDRAVYACGENSGGLQVGTRRGNGFGNPKAGIPYADRTRHPLTPRST